MSTRRERPLGALLGMLVVLAGLAQLHLLHLFGGHHAFNDYGPLITAVIAATIIALVPRRTSLWRRLTLASLVLLVLLGSEWLEAEVRADHSLTVALLGHGRLVAFALGTALAVVVLVQAERTLARLYGAFSGSSGS